MLKALFLAAVAVLSLEACAVRMEPRMAAGMAVEIAPPAPLFEIPGIAPSPESVWVDGYWEWMGVTYVWRPGCWVVRPHPRAVWVNGTWSHHPHGWARTPGHWSR